MKHNLSGRRRERGFTLVEIMVVIVILGLLAGLVVPNVLGHTDTARMETARTDTGQIHSTATIYATRNGRVPTMEDLLEPDDTGNPYIEGGEPPLDPWGNPYILRQSEGRLRFEVVSFGQDGLEDTEDDITYPKRAGN